MKFVATHPDHWQRTPLGSGLNLGLRMGLILLALLFVYGATAIGLGALVGGAMLAAAFAFLVWQRPILGAGALIVLGSFHQFLMLLIFHATGSGLVVKMAQVWKEIVVVTLVLKVIDLAFRRRTAPRLYLLDLGILIFLAYGCLYLAYPGSVEESSLFSKMMGLRADAFFLLAYFIGRGLTISIRQVRSFLIAFSVIVLIIAVAAGAQFVAPTATNLLFEMLSFSAYMELQRGAVGSTYAIRANEIAGAVIPRASSFFMADLALAFYTMLVVPLMAALCITLPQLRQKLAANVALLAALTTAILTVTRSAIIALVPMLAALVVWSRAFLLPVLVAVQMAAIAVPVAFSLNLTPNILRAMLSPSEASTQGHLQAIELSLEVLREEPFGRGLGTSGQVSQRLSPQESLTNESWYLQIATELGVVAGLLFAAILIGFGIVAFAQYTRVRDPWLKALCLGMGGATIGFVVVSATLHAWDNLTVSIMFWLLAGLVVRAQAIEQCSSEATDAYRRLA